MNMSLAYDDEFVEAETESAFESMKLAPKPPDAPVIVPPGFVGHTMVRKGGIHMGTGCGGIGGGSLIFFLFLILILLSGGTHC